ncbi:MAG: 50S ribosomal protein L29 [Gammaproteobacteria bacterium]|nr:50S ribosomal protein L29 [Gammaproteobacteria bacterium]
MSVKDMRAKSAAELTEQLVALRREQFNLRVQQATGQQARADEVKRVRRDIARLKTVLRERELREGAAGNRQ